LLVRGLRRRREEQLRRQREEHLRRRREEPVLLQRPRTGAEAEGTPVERGAAPGEQEQRADGNPAGGGEEAAEAVVAAVVRHVGELYGGESWVFWIRGLAVFSREKAILDLRNRW
jgi:hypothetical protein